MSGLIQLFRSRVGVAIVGAILVGGVGAAFGVGSVWHPVTPITGGVVQTAATATTQATNTPESTATPVATATTVPTVGPIATATPFPVGGILHGTVLSVNTGANSFVVSHNGIHYTILVNGATSYGGAATQLSGLHGGYRATVTIAAVQDNTTYVAGSVASVIDN